MFNLSPVTFYSIACALLPCIVYMAVYGRKRGKIHNVWILIFLVYIWQVFDVTGIGTLSDILSVPEGSINPSIIKGTINLVPFTGINLSFFLNIIMCVPLGFLLPLVWKDCRKLYRTALFGAGFSLLIEISQLVTTRATDIDDLIANICGTLIGYVIWKIFVKIANVHLKHSIKGITEPIVYTALSFLGMFFLYHPFWFYVHVLGM